MELNYLKHHGIKGQKWGRRRYQNPDGSLTPAGQKRYGDDDGADARGRPSKPANHEHHDRVRAKPTSQMSDAELREAVNRFQMEMQYKQLTTKPKSKWVTAAENVLIQSGSEVAKAQITKYANKGINALVNKAVTDGISAPDKIVRFVADRIKIKSF